MALGIIVATSLEFDIILSNITKCRSFRHNYKFFYQGEIHSNIPVIACVCGVGKVNAAYGATIMLEKFKVDKVYTIGIGGAYPSSGLRIEDIVIAEKEIYGDEGLALKNSFHTLEEIQLPLIECNSVKYYNEFKMYIPQELKSFKKKGNFVTLSSCTGSLTKAYVLEQKFNALCENMEGAAIAHICTLYGKPNVEIRGISNIINERTSEPLSRQDLIRASHKVQEFFIEFCRNL